MNDKVKDILAKLKIYYGIEDITIIENIEKFKKHLDFNLLYNKIKEEIKEDVKDFNEVIQPRYVFRLDVKDKTEEQVAKHK